jgi:hypothetical protein
LSCVLCTLYCQFLWIFLFIAPSVFLHIYLSCLLCTLCCQFPWIVKFVQYNLVVPEEDFRLRKYYFDFTWLNFS